MLATWFKSFSSKRQPSPKPKQPPKKKPSFAVVGVGHRSLSRHQQKAPPPHFQPLRLQRSSSRPRQGMIPTKPNFVTKISAVPAKASGEDAEEILETFGTIKPFESPSPRVERTPANQDTPPGREGSPTVNNPPQISQVNLDFNTVLESDPAQEQRLAPHIASNPVMRRPTVADTSIPSSLSPTIAQPEIIAGRKAKAVKQVALQIGGAKGCVTKYVKIKPVDSIEEVHGLERRAIDQEKSKSAASAEQAFHKEAFATPYKGDEPSSALVAQQPGRGLDYLNLISQKAGGRRPQSGLTMLQDGSRSALQKSAKGGRTETPQQFKTPQRRITSSKIQNRQTTSQGVSAKKAAQPLQSAGRARGALQEIENTCTIAHKSSGVQRGLFVPQSLKAKEPTDEDEVAIEKLTMKKKKSFKAERRGSTARQAIRIKSSTKRQENQVMKINCDLSQLIALEHGDTLQARREDPKKEVRRKQLRPEERGEPLIQVDGLDGQQLLMAYASEHVTLNRSTDFLKPHTDYTTIEAEEHDVQDLSSQDFSSRVILQPRETTEPRIQESIIPPYEDGAPHQSMARITIPLASLESIIHATEQQSIADRGEHQSIPSKPSIIGCASKAVRLKSPSKKSRSPMKQPKQGHDSHPKRGELNRLLAQNIHASQAKPTSQAHFINQATKEPTKSMALLDAIKNSVEKTAKSLENISFSQSLTRSGGKPSKDVIRIKQLKRQAKSRDDPPTNRAYVQPTNMAWIPASTHLKTAPKRPATSNGNYVQFKKLQNLNSLRSASKQSSNKKGMRAETALGAAEDIFNGWQQQFNDAPISSKVSRQIPIHSSGAATRMLGKSRFSLPEGCDSAGLNVSDTKDGRTITQEGQQYSHVMNTSILNESRGQPVNLQDTSFLTQQWKPLDQIPFPLTNQITLEHRDKSLPDLADFNYLSKCTSKLSVGTKALDDSCSGLGIIALVPNKNLAATNYTSYLGKKRVACLEKDKKKNRQSQFQGQLRPRKSQGKSVASLRKLNESSPIRLGLKKREPCLVQHQINPLSMTGILGEQNSFDSLVKASQLGHLQTDSQGGEPMNCEQSYGTREESKQVESGENLSQNLQEAEQRSVVSRQPPGQFDTQKKQVVLYKLKLKDYFSLNSKQ